MSFRRTCFVLIGFLAAGIAGAQVVQLGGGCSGASISATSRTQNCVLDLTVSGMPPGQQGTLFADVDNGVTIPIGPCTAHPANGPVALQNFGADGSGSWTWTVVVPSGLAGMSFRLQALLFQAGGPISGFLSLSNAIKLTVLDDAADLDNLYVDANNTNVCPGPNGSAVSPFLNIAAAIAVANDGATINVAAGVYQERIEVFGKSLTIVGANDPTTTLLPLHTVIKPSQSVSSESAICQLGTHDPNGTDKDRTVILRRLHIDGEDTVPAGCVLNYGVRFSNASGSLDRCIVENIGLTSYGCQSGIAVRSFGAYSQPQVLSFGNSIFRRWDKQAFALRGSSTVTWQSCTIEGMGLNAPSQNSQNGIFFRDAVAGTFNNCTFKDIGPSGGPTKLIATDGSYGYCAGVFNNSSPFNWDSHSYLTYERPKSDIVLTNNTFLNCQGIWIDLDMYEGRPAATWKKNSEIVNNNPGLAQNGGWISWGPVAESADLTGNMSVLGSHLQPGPYNQDSMLQYALENYTAFGLPTFGFSENVLVLGPGTYEDDSFSIDAAKVPTPFAVRSYQGAVNPVTTWPRGPEATIKRTGTAYPEGFYVNMGSVTLEGLRFEGMVDSVYLSGTQSGYQVLRNVFENNKFGLYLNSNGASPTTVAQNRFLTNNMPGASSGNGIYADQGTHNVLIDGNAFGGHTNAGIVLTTTGPLNTNVTISNNTSTNDAGFLALFGTTTSSISGNTISGCSSSAIALGGGVSNTSVSGNNLSNLASRGIRVEDLGFGPGVNSSITVQNNVIAVNNPTANRAGIVLAGATGSSVVNGNSVTWSGTITGAGVVNGIEITGPSTGAVAVTANTVFGGSIGGMAGSGSAGIRIDNLAASSSVVVNGVNAIRGFDHGIRCGNLPSASAVVVNFNNICGNLANPNGGIRYDFVGGSPFILQAEFNWYGTASGPFNALTNPSGTGNGDSDFVDYAPVLPTGPTCQ